LAREQRKLAAIFAADVIGYSRLTGRDESGTLHGATALRNRIAEVLAKPAVAIRWAVCGY
jgi:class 3 adenylate cyclase